MYFSLSNASTPYFAKEITVWETPHTLFFMFAYIYTHYSVSFQLELTWIQDIRIYCFRMEIHRAKLRPLSKKLQISFTGTSQV